MTVGELIEKLKKVKREAIVFTVISQESDFGNILYNDLMLVGKDRDGHVTLWSDETLPDIGEIL